MANTLTTSIASMLASLIQARSACSSRIKSWMNTLLLFTDLGLKRNTFQLNGQPIWLPMSPLSEERGRRGNSIQMSNFSSPVLATDSPSIKPTVTRHTTTHLREYNYHPNTYLSFVLTQVFTKRSLVFCLLGHQELESVILTQRHENE